MNRAIAEAKLTTTDIPVGSIIVKEGNVIATAHNMREELSDTIAHSEILAIQQAQKKLKNWRLDNCDLYVTLEPCPMCAWAILQARIRTVYFGSYNRKYGAFGSVINLNNISDFKTKIYGGIEEKKCDKILEEFFIRLRKK
jgi:tRNA(adenine34) deaminase